jgi:methionine-rich copper-binding protein CopC
MKPPAPVRRRHGVLVALAVVGLFATGFAPGADAARRHTRLLKSLPAKDTVLAVSPASVELWFSEPIELSVSRIRLVAADGKPVPLGALGQRGGDAAAPVTATLAAPVGDGVYTVHWTAASKDGHAVKDSYSFTIRSR